MNITVHNMGQINSPYLLMAIGTKPVMIVELTIIDKLIEKTISYNAKPM